MYVYGACSVVERMVVSVYVEKDGDMKPPMASRFLHLLCSLLIPNGSSYWTAYSGLLYIVGSLGCVLLCCRVSVLGLYGSLLYLKQLIG